MVSGQKSLSPLEALPNDLLTEIMSRVGAHSRDDLQSCLLTCKELLASVDDPKIFKTLSIPHLVTNPLLAANLHKNTFNKCLQHSNPSALYIQGILDYFVRHDYLSGLRYLKAAADASVPEAVYLYGIIMIARGCFNVGRGYMEKLNWRNNFHYAENCWNNIRGSMNGIMFDRKLLYFRSLLALKPKLHCSLTPYHSVCPDCFYYKQLLKFIFAL